MKVHPIGIIMNGVTGRMGTNQHLIRSIDAIIKQGGVAINDSEVIMPEVVLVGRNENKLKQLIATTSVTEWTTDLDSVLKDDKYAIYFDAQTTGRRSDAIKKAVAAGKHIYCEKPVATSTDIALELYRICKDAGIKHGVVQDKLWLPGMLKLKRLMENDFFGERFSPFGGILVIGFLKDTVFLHNDPVGTIARKTMEGSSLTCSAIGAMFWIIFLAL